MELASSVSLPASQASLGIPVSSPDLETMHNHTKQSTLPRPRSSWKSALVDSQDPPRAKPPGFEVLDGTAHVTIPAEVLADPTPLWNSFIVGHFLGEAAPHIGKVHATVNRLWQNQEKNLKIDAQFISSKTILFRIENTQIKMRVLRRHCWHISDTPTVVQQWSPSTAKKKPDLSSIPIWVDFKNIPDNLFSRKGLLFLGDIIGSAQKLHPNTERCTRLDVARVLVEVNLNAELPTSICLRSEPENKIGVSYPWLPLRCLICKGWGHAWKECEATTAGRKANEKSSSTNGAGEPMKELNLAPSRPEKEGAETSGKNLEPLELVAHSSTPNNKVFDTEKTEEVRVLSRGKIKEVATGGGLPLLQELERTEPWTLVTRGKKSPGSSRMLSGQRVVLGDTSNPSAPEEDELPTSPKQAQNPNTEGPENDRMEEGEIQMNLLPGSSSDNEVESPKQQLTKQGERNINNMNQKKPATSAIENSKRIRQTTTRKSSSRKA